MAMVITTATKDAKGNITFPDFESAYGHIRLWANGVPSDVYILVGNFVPTGRNKLRRADIIEASRGMGKIFKKVKVLLSDYGPSKRQSFNMDIHVPQSFINRYK